MQHLIAAICLAGLALAEPLSAQGKSLILGDRLRVTLAEGVETIGTVTSLSQTGVTFSESEGGPSVHVNYSDMSLLELSLETTNHWKRGAMYGFLIGALPGAALGGAAANLCGLGPCNEPSTGEALGAMGAGAVIVGAPCMLLGMAIGATFEKETWETIPIPTMGGRLRISPMIDLASIGGGRRAVLGARIRF